MAVLTGLRLHRLAARVGCPLLLCPSACPLATSPTHQPQGLLHQPLQMTSGLLGPSRASPGAGTGPGGTVRDWRTCKSSCRVCCKKEAKCRWELLTCGHPFPFPRTPPCSSLLLISVLPSAPHPSPCNPSLPQSRNCFSSDPPPPSSPPLPPLNPLLLDVCISIFDSLLCLLNSNPVV